jgi:hypothetical protein
MLRMAIVLALSAAVAGCLSFSSSQTAQRGAFRLDRDEKRMREEVLSHISIGMEIEKAKEILERGRFKCSFGRDESRDRPEVKGAFCLVCSQFIPQKSWIDSFIISNEIKVYVLFEKGTVTDVRVMHIGTCL